MSRIKPIKATREILRELKARVNASLVFTNSKAYTVCHNENIVVYGKVNPNNSKIKFLVVDLEKDATPEKWGKTQDFIKNYHFKPLYNESSFTSDSGSSFDSTISNN